MPFKITIITTTTTTNMSGTQILNLDQERSWFFINKIKEHWHNKIREKHIDKFERLYSKSYGCHHNINRHSANLENIDRQNSLSGHHNVPSGFNNTSTQASSSTTVPATPRAPPPSTSTTSSNSATGLPPSSNSHICTDHSNKWVIQLSKIPLTNEQLSLLQKGPNFAITPK